MLLSLFYWEKTKSLIREAYNHKNKQQQHQQQTKQIGEDSQRWAISNGGRMSNNRINAKDNMKTITMMIMMFQMMYRSELIWEWNSLNSKNQYLLISLRITKTNWIYLLLQLRRIHTIKLAIRIAIIVLSCHCHLF